MPSRFSRFQWPALKDRYDVVIIGGGAHGLACAYYLAKEHGITDVAVLERHYIGSGNSGRNTTIIRSNYLTPEGVRFYDASVKLYEGLSEELGFNVWFSQRGHLTLAHTEASVRTMLRRAETNQLEGIPSRVIWPDEIKKLCPPLDVSDRPRYPILGALYHPPGGVIRHNAVVWGYGLRANERGVHLHQNTEVTGIRVENGAAVGVETNRGFIKAGTIVSAVAGYTTIIGQMAGVPLPISSYPLQACVSEMLKRFLDVIIVSGSLHVYVSQADKGELVMGASVEPFGAYNREGTLSFLEDFSAHLLELFPALQHVRILRQWAGVCDMTPDYSPILGFTPVKNFLIDAGWGTWGFKASPICGKTMAQLIATQRTPELIEPFRLSRFYERGLVGEKGAASVGH
jgi:sarcosine oxidase subunit beta